MGKNLVLEDIFIIIQLFMKASSKTIDLMAKGFCLTVMGVFTRATF